MKPFLKATVVSSLLCSVLSFGSIGHAVTIQTGWTNSSTRIGLDTYETDTSGAKINTRTDEGWLSLLRGRNISFIPDPENEYADTSNFLSAQKSDAGETNSLQSLDLSGTTWSNGQKIRLGFWLMNSSNSTSDENQATSVVSDIYYDDPGTITGVISASDLESGQPNPIYDQISTGIGNDKILVYEDAYIFNINTFGYDSINLSNDSNSKKLTINTGNLLGSPNYDYRISVDDHNFKYYLIDFVVQPDVTAPTGYSVAFNDDRINATEATSTSFSFSGAEVGASYSYSIDDSSTSTPAVTGSGQVSSANQTISNINVSSLSDGILTLSFNLTDPAGNTGASATSQAEKDTTAPAAPTVSGVDGTLFNSSVTPNFSCSEGSLSTSGLSGWSNNSEISADGTYSLSGTCTDTAGNVSTQTTVSFTIDTIAPAAPTVSGVDGTLFNSSVTPNFSCSEGSLSTSGLSGWSNNSEISADGTYSLSGTCTDNAGNVSTQTTVDFTIDTIAPAAPTVSGVDGTLFNSSVTPNFSCSEGSLSTSGLSGWSNNSEISADGTYSLSGTCTDNAGNVSTQTTVDFTIDTIAPAAPTVSGVDGTLFNSSVTPNFSCSEGSLSTSGLSGWSNNSEISADGTYSLSGTCTDTAGNTSTQTTVDFTIDTTPPAAPTVSGVDGTLFNSSVTPNFSCSEGSLSTSGLSGWSNNSEISADGTYSLSGTCTDNAGNVSTQTTVDFTIDTIAPAAPTVSGVDGTLFNSSVTPNFSCSEGSLSTSGLSGWSNNSEISADGTYSLSGTCTDNAGNVSTQTTVSFTIDTIAPAAPTVSGVDGTLFNSSVTPNFSCSEGSLSTSGLSGWSNNSEISADGTYSLSGTCTDNAGNVSTQTTVDFTIDTIAPAAPTVSGVDGTLFNSSVTPNFSCSEGSLSTSGLSGWSNNSEISADGTYSLSGTCTDNAGNVSTQTTVDFTIDTIAPAAPTVSGVDGTLFNSSVTPNFSCSEGSLSTSGLSGWSNNSEISADGTYSLSGTCTDTAGNTSTQTTVDFTIDTTPPAAPTVSGVDGTLFNSSVTPNFSCSEGSLSTSGLSGWSNNSEISADGTYSLSGTCTDNAGNVSGNTTVGFEIDTTPPANYSVAFDDLDDLINTAEQSSVSFTITNAEVGASYSYSISDGSNTVSNPQDVDLTITSASNLEFDSFTVTGIDLSSLSDGELTLTVSLTDPAGNTGADEINTVKKDTAAPTGSVSYSPELSTDTNGSVTVTVTCSDEQDGSGCVDPQQSGWTYDSSSNSISKSFDANTENTSDPESVTIKDNAGNTASISYSVTNIDTTNPTGSVSYSPELSTDTNGSVTVTVTCSDEQDGSGCVDPQQSGWTYDSSSNSISKSFDANTENTSDPESVTIKDNAGNTASISYSVTNIDTTNPTGSVSYSPELSTDTNGSVTVTVTCSDEQDGSGCVDPQQSGWTYDSSSNSISKSFDANTENTSDPESVTIKDNAGNTASISYSVTNIDTTNPTGSVSYSPELSTDTNGSVTVTVTCSDEQDGSGCVDPQQSGWTYDSSSNSISKSFDANTENTSDPESVTIKDNAGNTASISYSVTNIDTTNPTGSVSYSPELSTDTNGSVTVTVTCSDEQDGSGCVDPQQSGWTYDSSSNSISKSFDANTENTSDPESVTIKDNAGNTASISYSVTNIDTTNPTGSVSYSPELSTDTNGSVTVTVTCSDEQDGSGCVDPQQSGWTYDSSSNSISKSFDANTENTSDPESVTIKDNAGNTASISYSVTNIDTTAPTGYSATFDDLDGLIKSDEQSAISFSFSNAEVGAAYSYSINDNDSSNDDTVSPITGSGSIDASNQQITTIDVSSLSDGDLTLTVSLTDPAGNVGADATNTVLKDTYAPTITGSVVATDNSYVDLTLSEASYTNANATGALQVNDFKISNFSAENSDLVSVAIDAITQPDNVDQTLATALTGGETPIRLWLNTNRTNGDSSIDDPASGGETLDIQVATPTSIYDTAGNPMDPAQKASLTLNDEIQPTIIDATTVANTNEYIDITFSEGVYGDEIPGSGREILIINDFSLTFAQNGGSATGASISDISQPNSEKKALLGGEATIRLWLTITGDPTGIETIEVSPVADRLYDAAGLVMDSSQTTGAVNLSDETGIYITDSEAEIQDTLTVNADSTDNEFYITVNFSEGAFGKNDSNQLAGMTPDDWAISLTPNGNPNAQSAKISGLTNVTDDNTLNGGETEVLFFLQIVDDTNGNGDAVDSIGTETVTISPKVTNGATNIYDADGNPMDPEVEANTITLSLSDTTSPTVSEVFSPSGNGPFNDEDTVEIWVVFDEPIAVTADDSTNPRLFLNTGNTDSSIENYANYTGTASNNEAGDTDTMVFEYQVQDGDETSDLSTDSLEANGATITDTSVNNNTADLLSLKSVSADNSLAERAGSDIVLDTTHPTVAVNDVTAASDTRSTPPYGEGEIIYIDVEFSESVEVTDTPTLTLATTSDSSGTNAIYDAQKSSEYDDGDVVVFKYTVQSGDNSNPLNYITTGALSGTITDEAGNSFELSTFPDATENNALAGANIVVDTTQPEILSITSANGGTYRQGSTVYFNIEFNELVTLNVTGNTDSDGNLTDGLEVTFNSGGTVLINEALLSSPLDDSGNLSGTEFTGIPYIIGDGETTNGADLQVTGFKLINATLVDDANNAINLEAYDPATINLKETDDNNGVLGIIIDGLAPTITKIEASNGKLSTEAGYDVFSAGAYNEDEEIYINVTFSEPVTLANGRLQLSLNTAPVQILSINAFQDSQEVIFNYTVAAGESVDQLDVTGIELINASDNINITATLQADETPVDLILPNGQNLADNNAIQIDAIDPVVTASFTTTDGTTNIDVGNGATYGEAISDVFLVCVEQETGCTGNYTLDGSVVTSSSPDFSESFDINSTTTVSYSATDDAGNLTEGSFVVTIDEDAPYAGVTYSRNGTPFDPETDQVKDGDKLEIFAEFSEVLTLDGDSLQLTLDGADPAIENVAMTTTDDQGSKDYNKKFTYTYTVDGPDGVDTDITLNFSGATDAYENTIAANATSGGSFTIDNSAPVAVLTYEINGAAFDASTQSVSAGETLTIIATFDQPLVENTVSITLTESDSTTQNAQMTAIDDTNEVFTYNYKVTEETEEDEDEENRVITITINNGADLAGNTVESTPTNNTFTVDSSPPTVTAITYDPTGPQADGTVVRISAEFSEAVSVPSIDISQTSELRSSSEDPVYKMEVDPNDATLYYFNYEIDSTKDETVPSQSGFSQIEIFDFYDLAGNTGTDYPTSDSDHLFIDNEAPLFSVDLEGGTYYSTEAISILPNCLNSTSGSSVSDIDKIYYTSAFDSSDSLVVATDPKTADEADVTELSAGTTIQVVTGRYENYQFYCTDAAGNESETHSHTYFVDPNGISASIDYDKGESPTYKQQDTVNFTVTFNAAVNPSDSPQLTLISDDTESADNGAVITLEVSNDDNTAENTKYTGSYTIAGDKDATIDVTVARTSGDEDTVPIAETPTKGGSFSVDNTVPTATAFNPANGATAIAESTNLEITFSEVVNLSDAGGSLDIYADGILSQEVELENASDLGSEELISGLGSETLIINPTNDLPDGAEIYILIDSGALEDGAGNPFAGITDETTWSFSTTDTTAPTVSISPEGDNVSVGTEVTITFSEAIRNIDDSDIDNTNVGSLLTFKETDASGVDVAFSAEINSAKTIITLNPSSTLTKSQTYYVAVAAVEDSAGNASTPTTATFTTSAECGNGDKIDAEQCDDGNTDDGDGCSSSCQIESGWLCIANNNNLSVCESSGGSGNGGGSADPPAGDDIDVTWLDSITNYLMPTAMAQTASDPLEIPINRSVEIDFKENIYFVGNGSLADLLITTSTPSTELSPIFTLNVYDASAINNIGDPVDFTVTYEEDTSSGYYALIVDPDEGTESAPTNWAANGTYILTLQGGTIQKASLQHYSKKEYYLTVEDATVTDGILEIGEDCDDGDDSVAGDGCTNGEVDEGYTCTNNSDSGVASTCSEVPEDSTSNNGSSTNSSSGGGGGIPSLGAPVGICQSSRSGALSCADMYILETPYASSYRECLLETNDQGYTNSEDYCIEQWVAERGYQSCDDTDPSFLGKSGAAYQEALAAMCSGTQVEVTGISAENLSELTETLEANEEDLEDSIAELTACNQPQLYLRQTIARSLTDEYFGASQLVLTVPSDELVRYEISAEYCIPANYQIGDLTIEEVTLLASGGYVYGKSAEPNWNQSLTEHQGTISWYYTATADTLTGFDRGQIQTMVLGQLDYQEPMNCDAENGCQYISGSLGSLSNSSSLTNLMSLVGSQQAGATTLHVVRPFTESLAGAATNPAASTNFALLENLSAYDEKAVTSVELWGNSFRTTPDNSGVYFLDQGNLTLGGELDLEGQSRTIVIKSGSLNLTEDLTLKNGFAAFIVETGDLTVAADIERLEGLYILPVGEISAEKSSLPLTISGGLLADTTPLWMARKFIGLIDENGDVSLDQLQPAVSIYFDFRLLSETPPALESLPLSQWEQR